MLYGTAYLRFFFQQHYGNFRMALLHSNIYRFVSSLEIKKEKNMMMEPSMNSQVIF